MTVASSTSRIQYNCSGGTTYAFAFGVGATSEIQVILTDSAGVETILTETTNYTVTATNSDFSAGGTVTTVAAYAAGNTITILRNVPLTQGSDFVEGMPTLYETFEDGLDKLTRIAQQIKEIINRSMTLPVSSTASAVMPPPAANAYLAWNAGATALESRTLINQGSISNAAYDATAWLGVEDVSPSKNAVRNELETKLTADGFATAAEIITGTETAKAIAPDQLAASHIGVPAGAEMLWPTETPPAGWLEENGASILRASYPALFAVIGTMYGTADATHFNLPDMRGKFPRIWDHAAAIDPGRATRTAPTTTGATLTAGDHVGTEQAEGFKSHTHTGTVGTALNGNVSTGVGGAIIGVQSNGLNAAIGSTGGNETRPVNAYRMMIIKY